MSGKADAIGTVSGTLNVKVTGGIFNGSFIGCGDYTNIQNLTNDISGGTFNQAFSGCGSNCTIGTLINNISDGTFNNIFEGTGGSLTGNVTNNISGGTFKNESTYCVSSDTSDTITGNVTNTFSGDIDFTHSGPVVYGSACKVVGNVTNNFDGCDIVIKYFYGSKIVDINTAIDTDLSQPGAVQTTGIVTNNFKNGSFTGTFMGCWGWSQEGTNSPNTVIENNFYSGFSISTFYGTGRSSTVKSVTNNVYGGEFKNWCGTGQNGTASNGGLPVKVGVVKNNFYGGTFRDGGNIDGTTANSSLVGEVHNTFKKVLIPGTSTYTTGATFKRHFRGAGASSTGISSITNTVEYATFKMGFFPAGWQIKNADLDVYTEITGGNFESYTASQGNADNTTNDLLTFKSNKTVIKGGNFSVCVKLIGAEGGKTCYHDESKISIEVQDTINIAKETNFNFTAVSAGKTVTFNQTEQWVPGQVYVTYPETVDETKVLSSQGNGVTGLAAKRDKADDDTKKELYGMIVAPSARLELSNRIVLHACFPVTEVNAILDQGKEFDYSFDLGNLNLGSGKITKETATAKQESVDYYVVVLTAVDAANFAEDITYSGAFISGTTSVEKICGNGIDNNEQEITPAEKLFMAVANYGAIAKDPAANAPYSDVTHNNVETSTMINNSNSEGGLSVLFGDAIGIRFHLESSDAEVVVKVDGTTIDDKFVTVTPGANELTVDLFWNVKDMQKQINLVIEVGGAKKANINGTLEQLVAAVGEAGQTVTTQCNAVLAYIQAANAYLAANN